MGCLRVGVDGGQANGRCELGRWPWALELVRAACSLSRHPVLKALKGPDLVGDWQTFAKRSRQQSEPVAHAVQDTVNAMV